MQNVSRLEIYGRPSSAEPYPDSVAVYVPKDDYSADGWPGGSLLTNSGFTNSAYEDLEPDWGNADATANNWSTVGNRHRATVADSATPRYQDVALDEKIQTRYLRLHLKTNGTSAWNWMNISAIRVYGDEPAEPVEKLAITEVRATNSHTEGSGPASMADGSPATYWQSDYSSATEDPVIELDLGYVQKVKWVEIDKAIANYSKSITDAALSYNQTAADYWSSSSGGLIVAADNGEQTWKEASAVPGGLHAAEDKAVTQTVTLRPNSDIEARYLRIALEPGLAGNANDMAVSEIRVYGQSLEPEPPSAIVTGSTTPPESKLSLWYDKPAEGATRPTNGDDSTLNLNNDRLPIGNGWMGAMLEGTVTEESIQFNEKTLWSGGPGGVERDGDNNLGNVIGGVFTYNYGYGSATPSRASLYDQLKAGTHTGGANGVNSNDIQGNFLGFGRYKNFGYLDLDYRFPGGETEVTDYRRELDLENSISKVSYKVGDTTYTREYIASYPEDQIAVHLSTDDGTPLNLSVSARSGQSNHKNHAPEVTASGDTVTLTGDLQDNGLRYAAAFKVTHTGGTMTTNAKSIDIADADSITVYFTAGTDYRRETELPESDAVDYTALTGWTWRTGETLPDLANRIRGELAGASDSGYADFKAAHTDDYRELFDRVELDLGGENTLPTDDALLAYKAPVNQNQANARFLETILYQYGRYLLISSSREGTLPANLQGVWNDNNVPYWSSDYHTNINLQMNYWPAGGANLLETMEPLQSYLDTARLTGRLTAQKYNHRTTTSSGGMKSLAPIRGLLILTTP